MAEDAVERKSFLRSITEKNTGKSNAECREPGRSSPEPCISAGVATTTLNPSCSRTGNSGRPIREFDTAKRAVDNIFAANNLPGMALHASGALLYSAMDLGIDIVDVNHGSLAERVVLNEQVAGQSGTLAVDETRAWIYVVTNDGLTIIDLDPVPFSIGRVTPSAAMPGSSVQIRGSGFQTGTAVTINRTAAITTMTDSDTFQVTVPSLLVGFASIVVSNPGGVTYELDGVFGVQ